MYRLYFHINEAHKICMPYMYRLATNKKALPIDREGSDKKRQRLTLPGFIQVPSALVGLTALFGMGRGDPHRYSHLKIFNDITKRRV